MSDERELDLAGKIIGLAMKVHRTLGPGFLESVYENALAIELERSGFAIERQKPRRVLALPALSLSANTEPIAPPALKSWFYKFCNSV